MRSDAEAQVRLLVIVLELLTAIHTKRNLSGTTVPAWLVPPVTKVETSDDAIKAWITRLREGIASARGNPGKPVRIVGREPHRVEPVWAFARHARRRSVTDLAVTGLVDPDTQATSLTDVRLGGVTGELRLIVPRDGKPARIDVTVWTGFKWRMHTRILDHDESSLIAALIALQWAIELLPFGKDERGVLRQIPADGLACLITETTPAERAVVLNVVVGNLSSHWREGAMGLPPHLALFGAFDDMLARRLADSRNWHAGTHVEVVPIGERPARRTVIVSRPSQPSRWRPIARKRWAVVCEKLGAPLDERLVEVADGPGTTTFHRTGSLTALPLLRFIP